MSKVFFIGAGPGDPELITLKGKRLIEESDVIIYAGSLVNPEVLNYNKKNAKIYDSAKMNLEEIIEVMKDSISKGLCVARVHTGDPSIYGSIREQIEELKKLNIDFEVVPGVSSFTAAASVLQKEFTVPSISQTVICTRFEGNTPVPTSESIELLASHKTSMVIFLSIHKIEDLVQKLLLHYKEETPISVVYKATWVDQKIVSGTLKDISQKVKNAGIKKTALILVGDFLGNKYDNSKLYDKFFATEFRDAKCSTE
ncbi:MAG: precorrin-4 C(11)-methyltransferase [Spirochaetes bacterium GWC1_27_15]|nr:MAG: precorrin-4 C(11)-methyltransferase [Spirochaetes bacterium GWB1_27_13]OHD27337.1 MAG: precorrin-4 C(11)-methyltransferase [Spirochaetes bacterium GWC1_27_15]